MAIIDQITRIETAASIIKAKTASLELDKADGNGKISSSDKLDVQAAAINAIPEGTPVTVALDATTTSVSLPKGYYGADSTISVSTMAAPTISLSTSQQTISCDDKMMDGNIVIPPANAFYTGSSAPTGSTPGNDGDLYLVV